MDIAYSVSWDDGKRGRRLAVLAAGLMVVLATAPVARAGVDAAADLISVIVRDVPGAGDAPESFVERVGGTVLHRYAVLDGFSARVPAERIDQLRAIDGVLAVTADARIALHGKGGGGSSTEDTGDLGTVASMIKSNTLHGGGIDGSGVDVALIDSGVVGVDGLRVSGKVINGPDLSFESQSNDLRYMDTYGHGTHMAGIIAGRSDDASFRRREGWSGSFVGIAPGARLVSVKVANARGATDVSQVIAAIDWVVQHRNSNGMNIRVLNLSFGTTPLQSYVLDPLAYAAEVAWRKGIFVVVAAGNDGNTLGQLNNPAFSPRVFAVGANDTKGTSEVSDDVIPSWSSRGDGIRNPDVVAPGKSIKSLRVPGSYLDQEYPGAHDGSLFRGSGTSQSAAVAAGAAALLVQQRPTITPDQLKKLLTSTARSLPAANAQAQGAGLINFTGIANVTTPSTLDSAQPFALATGTGSLHLARGGATIEMDGVTLTGEQDIMGKAWVGSTWSSKAWNETSWTGGSWNGASWSGSDWSGASWSGASWSGASWSGASWSGASWSGASWSGASWSGASWSGASWSSALWG